MKTRKPIIALAPIRYFDENRNHNLAKIKKYIRIAARSGADIVCFPESCIKKSGHIPLDSKYIQAIQEECKKNSIWCIITEDIMLRTKVYNIALLIDRKGKIRGRYKKINLYGDKVSPGHRVKVFKTDFGRVGVVICWDLTFAKLFETMKKAGAEIVFCPSQWWYDTQAHKNRHKQREIKLLRSLIQTRAYENIYFIALCNPIVDSKYQVSYSAIASPHKILKESIDTEGLITSEVNLNDIKKFRKFYSKE